LLSIFFPPESNSIKICKRKKILLVLSIKVWDVDYRTNPENLLADSLSIFAEIWSHYKW
jgi:hypothetical protein